ncbi:MAG: DUF4097 domain-containing protein [Gammaproteobacteria bacterium]|nr:MAG: DUF4097 domain-containing protein [Gammaproteobacteria bacterium]
MRTGALLPTMMMAVLASAAARAAGDNVFERQVAADPRGVVEISNVSGRIKVSGWDRAQVSVRGELGAGVERIDVTSDHGHTMIKVVLPSYSFRSGSVDLWVQVPRGSELDVSAVSADVTATDVQGVQRLKTVSGEIRADIGQSDVEVKTISGDITLSGHGQPAQLHVSTVSGSLRVEHGAGELEATAVSGAVTVRLDSARSVRVRTTSGDLRFEGKLLRGASFDAESVSGELIVRASAQAGYEYEVTTFSGDIRDCFNVEAERTDKYGPGHRLSGTRAAGGAHVRLRTMSGGVELCDRD